MQALPSVGVHAKQVLEEVARLRATDLPIHGGRLFAYVYTPAMAASTSSPAPPMPSARPVNGPSLLVMENAVVGRHPRCSAAGPMGCPQWSAM